MVEGVEGFEGVEGVEGFEGAEVADGGMGAEGTMGSEGAMWAERDNEEEDEGAAIYIQGGFFTDLPLKITKGGVQIIKMEI